MVEKTASGRITKLVAGLLAGNLFILPALAQSDPGQEAAKATPTKSAPTRRASPYRQINLTHKAKDYYTAAWGVDKLKVSQTASGNLIRFSYRVTDPALAKFLGDKTATAYMLGQKSHALLQVPVMDKVGQLRQTGTPQAGQEYWMAFSNKRNLIKSGDRVNVMIGSFHADGLMVE